MAKMDMGPVIIIGAAALAIFALRNVGPGGPEPQRAPSGREPPTGPIPPPPPPPNLPPTQPTTQPVYTLPAPTMPQQQVTQVPNYVYVEGHGWVREDLQHLYV